MARIRSALPAWKRCTSVKTVLSVSNPDTFGPGVLLNGKNVILFKGNASAQIAEAIIGLLRDPTRKPPDRSRGKSFGRASVFLVCDHRKDDRFIRTDVKETGEWVKLANTVNRAFGL